MFLLKKIVGFSGGSTEQEDDSDGRSSSNTDNLKVKKKRLKKKKKPDKMDKTESGDEFDGSDDKSTDSANLSEIVPIIELSKSKLLLNKFIGKVPDAVPAPIQSETESEVENLNTSGVVLRPVLRPKTNIEEIPIPNIEIRLNNNNFEDSSDVSKSSKTSKISKLTPNDRDKSQESESLDDDGSTGKDISEISRCSSVLPETDDVDFWKTIEETKSEPETTNFDDFWADFDEGMPKKKSIPRVENDLHQKTQPEIEKPDIIPNEEEPDVIETEEKPDVIQTEEEPSVIQTEELDVIPTQVEPDAMETEEDPDFIQTEEEPDVLPIKEDLEKDDSEVQESSNSLEKTENSVLSESSSKDVSEVPEISSKVEVIKIPTPPPLPPPVSPLEFPKLERKRKLNDFNRPLRRRSTMAPEDRERIRECFTEVPNPNNDQGDIESLSSYGDDDIGPDFSITDYLGRENDKAEARLAARRLARVEAREIRLKEIERQQREQEEESDKFVDLHGTTIVRSSNMSPRDRTSLTNSYHSSRRSSEDSIDDGSCLRDIRHELKEVDEKFRKAMIANAQLDNDKAALSYQVELLKDKFEELEDSHSQLGREHREKCREYEALKRATVKLKEEFTVCRACLEERDQLIADYGLVIVGGDADEAGEIAPRALVTQESASILQASGEGSLDVRLKRFAEEKEELSDQVRHLKLELEEEKNRHRNDKSLSNGLVDEELNQTLSDYKFRLQRADQDVSTFQATVARLESQVSRYKSSAETLEKSEEELKQEKRKLQRELRESLGRIEELETENSHLQRRMDKLKNAKSTLLKEL